MSYVLEIKYKDYVVTLPLVSDKARLVNADELIASIETVLLNMLPEHAPDDSGVVVYSFGDTEDTYTQFSQFEVNPTSYNAAYLVLVHSGQVVSHVSLCEMLSKIVWQNLRKALPRRFAVQLYLQDMIEMFS